MSRIPASLPTTKGAHDAAAPFVGGMARRPGKSAIPGRRSVRRDSAPSLHNGHWPVSSARGSREAPPDTDAGLRRRHGALELNLTMTDTQRPPVDADAMQGGFVPSTTSNEMPLRFIRIEEVIKMTARSQSRLYEDMRAGKFPKCVPIGGRAVAWVESEVIAWMREAMAAREKGRA